MFVGDPVGEYDRLLDFSTAVTGTSFFVPTATFLDAVAAGPPTPAPAPIAEDAPKPRSPDGSLGIGSLKKRGTA